MRIVLALAMASAVGCTGDGYAHYEETTTTFDEAIARFDIETGAGHIVIERGEVTSVRETRRWTTGEPNVSVNFEGGTLLVDAKCPFQPGPCDVSYDITVAYDADLSLHTGAGSIDIVGIGGRHDIGTGGGAMSVRGDGVEIELDANSGSGSIELIGVSGSLRVDSGGGSIVAESVGGELVIDSGAGGISAIDLTTTEFIAETGAGGINASFLTPPQEVDLQTGSGAVRVTVPTGAYDLYVDTGVGRVEVEGIESDPAAPNRIHVETGAGQVSVQGR